MTLTEKNLATLPVPTKGSTIYRDTEGRARCRGLGYRITAAGIRSWVLDYSVAGTRHVATLGRHPDLTLAMARIKANKLHSEIAQGLPGPLEAAAHARAQQVVEHREQEQIQNLATRTLSAVVELWLVSHGRPNKRPVSQANDKSILRRHILPRFGAKPVASITRADVKALMLHMQSSGIEVAANRTRTLLSTLFEFAVNDLEWCQSNPTRGIRKFRETSRLVSLTRDDLDRLHAAINASAHHQTADVLRLLLWTGCRKREALGAQWAEFDLDRQLWSRSASRLKQKTHSVIPLNEAAVGLLRRLRAKAGGSLYVFPGATADAPLGDISKSWRAIRKSAGLEQLHLHDARHIYAQSVLDGGASVDALAALLGHSNSRMGKIYATRSIEALRVATESAGKLLQAPRRLAIVQRRR